jgi:hypothetical protein
MQERLERLSRSVEYLDLEYVEGSNEDDKLDETSRISQSSPRNSVPNNIEGDSNHLQKQMVNEELHTLKEGADDDDDIVPHPETDRKIAKQESGPTVAEENNMYGDALVTNKQSEDRHTQLLFSPSCGIGNMKAPNLHAGTLHYDCPLHLVSIYLTST